MSSHLSDVTLVFLPFFLLFFFCCRFFHLQMRCWSSSSISGKLLEYTETSLSKRICIHSGIAHKYCNHREIMQILILWLSNNGCQSKDKNLHMLRLVRNNHTVIMLIKHTKQHVKDCQTGTNLCMYAKYRKTVLKEH